MENSTAIFGKETHFDVFISHRGLSEDEATKIHEALVNDHKKVYFSKANIIQSGEQDYWKDIIHAIDVSDLLVIFLKNPDDFLAPWIQKEYRLFFKSQARKNKYTPPLIVIHGFPPEDVPWELAAESHIIVYDDKNFNTLLNFCKAENLTNYSMNYTNKIFISHFYSQNKFIDIPLNLLSYFGFPRYRMTAFIQNFIIGIQGFNEVEENFHTSDQNQYLQRKWFKLGFEKVINFKQVNFDFQSKELLGLVIQIDLNRYDKYPDYIIDRLPSVSNDISNYFSTREPVILFNLLGEKAGIVAKELRGHALLKNPDIGFPPSEYKAFFSMHSPRMVCITKLREFFNGTLRAIDTIRANRAAYMCDPIDGIIELALHETTDGNSYENELLAGINDKLLLVALQCGYRFKTPFRELINSLVQKGITDGMLGLTVLCMDSSQADINVVKSWDVNKRRFLGLLTREEISRMSKEQAGFTKNKYFSDIYDDIIYH